MKRAIVTKPIKINSNRIPRKLFISFMLLVVSCADEPNFLQLGIESFKKENYSLAKNQLKMIKQSDEDFKLARKYLAKIDSIEVSHSKITQEKDSIRTNEIKGQMNGYLGNYKVAVVGATMDKSVEVYELKEGGNSVWLWVDYIGGRPVIDEKKEGTWWLDSKGNIQIRIQGNSGPIEEEFSIVDGRLLESTRKKRSLIKTQESF